MARTISTAIKQVRYGLQDDDAANYRYSNDRLIDTLNMALLDIWRMRPDLFLVTDWTLTEYTSASLADGSTLPIDDIYFSTVVKLIVGYVQLEDDSITPDSKAATMLSTARTELQGVA